MSHEPERQAEQLLQCLVQDKKPLGFLLGAGCPFSIKDNEGNPLIQDINGITKIVRQQVTGGILKEQWIKIEEPLKEELKREPNIEDLLSNVRGLREYVGNGEVRGLNRNNLDELELEITKTIKDSMSKELPNKNTPYHHLAVWIGAIDRSEPIEIFTTNYDLLIEHALEDMRTPYFDGFVGAHRPFFDPYAIEFDKLPSRWARLWKIHGSINWRSDLDGSHLKVSRTDLDQGRNVVIHPSHLKYDQSRKMPYLAMMDKLKKFLSTSSSALVIVGYSFGDQHLNDVIFQSLQGSPTTAVFALMYGPLSTYKSAIQLAKDRGNLSVISKDAAIIGTKEYQWKTSEDKPESNLPRGAVEWTKEEGEDAAWKASFELGDFKIFGEFLQDISGKKSSELT